MAAETGNADQLQFDLRALTGEIWRRKWRILLVTILLCAATYAVLLFVPKEYESSAALLVEPRDNIFLRAAGDTGSSTGGATDDVIVASQVELIQSADTLLRVVRDLNLDEIEEFSGVSNSPIDQLIRLIRPGGGERDLEQIALARLQQKLTVIRQRDSRLVSILVRSRDRVLAADIANAIANAHVSRRAELSVDDTEEASTWLANEIAKLRTAVSQAEAEVAQYRVDNDLFVGPNNTTLVDQQMADLSSQITAAQERRSTASSRAGLIRSLLNGGQPIDGVSDVRESVVIQSLSADKATLQGELAQLSATLLDNHPNIQAVRAQIAEVDNQIAIEGRRVASALEAEAEIESSLIQSLNDELTRLKLTAGNASAASVELQELEREAKAQRDLLENYLARFRDAASRTDSNAALPDVRVITFAVPALQPASPKTTLILAAVGFFALTLQVGLILFRELSFVPATVRAQDDFGEERQVASPVAPPRQLPVEEDRAPVMPAAAMNDAAPRTEEAQSEPEDMDAPDFTNIGAVIHDVVNGRTQVVAVLSLDHAADHAGIAEQLIISSLDQGLSVALVDAGSGSISNQLGLTDLTANLAEFGDVVQTSDIEGLTEVCWGTLPRLAPNSDRPATLVEALADIYEVVIVIAGTVGAGSNLKLFADLDARLVIAAGEKVRPAVYANVVEHAAEWGFSDSCLVEARLDASHVA